MSGTISDVWLRCSRKVPKPKTRLLCFPYAGGSASSFVHWQQRFAADVEVRAVQLPGRQDRFRERPITQGKAIVDHVEAALADLSAANTVLFGHSLGGLLAFELARRLQAFGTPPVGLVVGAAPAPASVRSGTPLHSLSDAEFLEAIHARYGTPWSVLGNADLMALALPALRADIQVLETLHHEAGPPLGAPVTFLRGLRDPHVTLADVSGWQNVARLPLQVFEIDAGHLFVEDSAPWVIAQIKRAL
jgi:surfactin synthase thioesterase subunit